MEKVRVEDAVGMVLCHDITEIVPGKFKGRAFAKGHIIQEEDIEKLLDLGKRHIYVWDLSKGYVHENEAALRMVQAAAGENIVFSEVKEGKIELRAACDGVLKINLDTLYACLLYTSFYGNPVMAIPCGEDVVLGMVYNETTESFEEYVPPELELTQLDRIEKQLEINQDELLQEGADRMMEELQKRGLIV